MAFYHQRAAFYHGKRPFLAILSDFGDSSHLWLFIMNGKQVLESKYRKKRVLESKYRKKRVLESNKRDKQVLESKYRKK